MLDMTTDYLQSQLEVPNQHSDNATAYKYKRKIHIQHIHIQTKSSLL